VEAVADGVDGAEATGAMRAALGKPSDGPMIGGHSIEVPQVTVTGRSPLSDEAIADQRRRLQRTMTTMAGVLRSEESLAEAMDVAMEIASLVRDDQVDPAASELRNLARVGLALLTGAAARTETRGAHTRTDFPETDDALRCRLVVGGS
jgi:L-aspartate oxidase